MNKKIMVDFTSNLVLLVLMSCLLLFPIFEITNIQLILNLAFGLNALIKLINFLVVWKNKDFEGLFTFLVCIGALIAINFINLTSKNIAMTLLIWGLFMCLIKLKKADFYHDRLNKMWILRIFILLVFMALTILVSINLIFNELTIILLAFYFFINSLLDTIDPIASFIRG